MSDIVPEGSPRRDLEDRILLLCSGISFALALGWLAGPLVLATVGRDFPVYPAYVALFAALAILLGFGLLRSVRLGRTEVVPQEDRVFLAPAIQQASDPIEAYTRLAGLIGITGVFRKLEFSGMPLATIIMTLVFCILSLVTAGLKRYFPEIPDQLATGFFDLAKLTLGAFIGSFVTKAGGREAEALRAGAVAAAVGAARSAPGIRTPPSAGAPGQPS